MVSSLPISNFNHIKISIVLPDKSPSLDIRTYLTTNTYTGFTNSGIRIYSENIPAFTHLQSKALNVSNNDAEIGRLKQSINNEVVIRSIAGNDAPLIDIRNFYLRFNTFTKRFFTNQ